jgi:hypothetical protein
MATFTDKLIFILLIIFTIAGFLFVREIFPSGSLAKISLDNKDIYILPLDEDRSVKITGPLGTSEVEIKDGKARMKESPCPRKLCVRQRWKDKGSIICLPNKVIITMGGNEQNPEDSEYDAVTK